MLLEVRPCDTRSRPMALLTNLHYLDSLDNMHLYYIAIEITVHLLVFE